MENKPNKKASNAVMAVIYTVVGELRSKLSLIEYIKAANP